MQKITLFLLFVFFRTGALYSQQTIDSIQSALANAKEDTSKVTLFLRAGKAVVFQDPGKAIEFYLAGTKLSKKINYPLGAGLCYMATGTSYSFLNKTDSSLIYMDTALTFLRTVNSADHLFIFFSNRADTYVQMSDFKKALLDCDSAANYEDRVIDRTRLAYVYNVRADIYWHLKLYDLNGEYVDKALAIHLAAKNYRMIGQAYADKGDLFVQKEEIAKGIEYYKKAIHIADSLNDESNLSRYYNSLGETYLLVEKTGDALTSATAALQYAKEEDNLVQQAYVHTLLCKIFTLQNNLPAAISNGRLAHYMAIEEVDFPLQQSSAVALATAFKKVGNIDSAYHYLQVSKDLNDSLITKNFNQEIANLQISFDVSQKEKQIELLAKDKELQQQKLQRQWLLLLTAGAIALLVFVGAWMFINRNRLKQRMKELELRNQIAADLHDEVGSSLSSIHMLSQMANSNVEGNQQKSILDKVTNNAKETMERMSDIVWMIKPGENETANLKQRMERFAQEISSGKNISLQMNITPIEDVKLTMEQRKNIYLVFKEAINNAVKYSGTKKIDVSILSDNRQLELAVKDYGKGFDMSKSSRGNGLDNMKNRAKESNGNLFINTYAEAGTEIKLIVSL